jgi:hypothetical protein
LREVFPWLQHELESESSGINKYYKLASHHDPMRHNAKAGMSSAGHLLMLKVAAIHHAVLSSENGSLVVWVDTDTNLRRPFTAKVDSWLRARDVTYTPFYMRNHNKNPFQNFDLYTKDAERRALLSEWWKVESGIMAITVNNKTLKFTARALDLYRNGLFELATKCFEKSSICTRERIGSNVFTNDVFIWALLLQCDAHGDEYFHVGLKHGWFSWKGFAPWRGGIQYGNYWWPLSFPAVNQSDALVTNFLVGDFVFHYFGYHHKGALWLQPKVSELMAPWRTVKDPGDLHKSLWRFVGDWPEPRC